jgi:hypothetical protein
VFVGKPSGEPVGDFVGKPSGEPVGDFVGKPSGETVGESLGEPVGEPVGVLVGEEETVGESLGETVGEFVESAGELVGLGVGISKFGLCRHSFLYGFHSHEIQLIHVMFWPCRPH